MERFKIRLDNDGTFTILDEGLVEEKGFLTYNAAVDYLGDILAEEKEALDRAREALKEAQERYNELVQRTGTGDKES